MTRIIDRLLEPEVAGCPLDGPERLAAHRQVLERKPMIRGVFEDFHRLFHQLDTSLLSGSGDVIELGAGIYPVRETLPGVLATDIVPAAHLDRTLNAQAMDLADSSVRAFYLQNVFHHFPDPDAFFRELDRTLVPGGGAILIEPNDGWLASILYPRLFASEGYDKKSESWKTPTSGPMSGANQALSHVIFDRDLAQFERMHPTIAVVHRDVLPNWIRYLASGGLNYRALVPEVASGILGAAESGLAFLRRATGLHRVIVLRKTAG